MEQGAGFRSLMCQHLRSRVTVAASLAAPFEPPRSSEWPMLPSYMAPNARIRRLARKGSSHQYVAILPRKGGKSWRPTKADPVDTDSVGGRVLCGGACYGG